MTNEGLTKAIAAVPAVESMCTQTKTLTSTLNSLRSGIGNLEVLGVKLGVVGLPAALAAYACP